MCYSQEALIDSYQRANQDLRRELVDMTDDRDTFEREVHDLQYDVNSLELERDDLAFDVKNLKDEVLGLHYDIAGRDTAIEALKAENDELSDLALARFYRIDDLEKGLRAILDHAELILDTPSWVQSVDGLRYSVTYIVDELGVLNGQK